ncbi:hypothetical protein [Pseudomonas sp. 313]|uniref:hypothetical protein n=1 Tax=Pseudomonas sp. 313 TaxID=1234594 RepID=UPI00036402A4|nr:hypothetical protein [Pseudomonas sp. 313]
MHLHHCKLINAHVQISEHYLVASGIGSEDVDEEVYYLCDYDEECFGCPYRDVEGCCLREF